MEIKRITGGIVFIAGLVVLLGLASLLCTSGTKTGGVGRMLSGANGIVAEKENSIDILVLGDSESYSSISPLQLWEEKGYTAYVCGSPGQVLTYSEILLHRAFRTQQPKIVILETNALYRKISPSNVAKAELIRFFPVFTYHDRWKTLGPSGLDSRRIKNGTESYKGYYYFNQVVPSAAKDYMAPTEAAAEVSDVNRTYIQNIKDFCNENGAKLILLSTPSSANWSYSRHNGVELLAKELGCEYIDLNLMNDAIRINWEKDTRDGGDHLNHAGATKVTHYLGEYLSEKGVLTDHRGDERYEHWNESLARLNAVIAGSSGEDADSKTKKP